MIKLVHFVVILSTIVTVSAEKTSKVKLCTTDDSLDGKCVPSHYCKNSETTGEGMFDIRLDQCEESEICCSLCGMRNKDLLGFGIVAEEHEANFGEFPWMVALLEKVSESNIYICGGSLIADNVVLTAAHCLNGSILSNLKIRAGEYDSGTTNELYKHSDYKVDKVVIHKYYNNYTNVNDIALLFLETKVVSNDIVSTICLPSQYQSFDYKNCIAMGWGKDKFNGSYQSTLKKIDLATISSTDCQEKLRKTRLGDKFSLNKIFMCAGGEEGKDVCTGDGGSPLVCPIEGVADQYYQAGIVSWGVGCGEKDVPGVYINVAKYRTWIDKQIKINS